MRWLVRALDLVPQAEPDVVYLAYSLLATVRERIPGCSEMYAVWSLWRRPLVIEGRYRVKSGISRQWLVEEYQIVLCCDDSFEIHHVQPIYNSARDQSSRADSSNKQVKMHQPWVDTLFQGEYQDRSITQLLSGNINSPIFLSPSHHNSSPTAQHKIDPHSKAQPSTPKTQHSTQRQRDPTRSSQKDLDPRNKI